MKETDVKDFFTGFADHFLQGNLDGIAAHFFYPCIIDNMQSVTTISNETELKEHEKISVDGFAANHISRADVKIKKFDVYENSVAMVYVAYDLFAGDHAAGTIKWLYQLTGVDQDPKIITAKFMV